MNCNKYRRLYFPEASIKLLNTKYLITDNLYIKNKFCGAQANIHNLTTQEFNSNNTKIQNLETDKINIKSNINFPQMDISKNSAYSNKHQIIYNTGDSQLYFSNGFRWVILNQSEKTYEPVNIKIGSINYSDKNYTNNQNINIQYIKYYPTNPPDNLPNILLLPDINGDEISNLFPVIGLYFSALGFQVINMVYRNTNFNITDNNNPDDIYGEYISSSSPNNNHSPHAAAYDAHKIHDKLFPGNKNTILLGIGFGSLVAQLYSAGDILDSNTKNNISLDICKLILASASARIRNGVPYSHNINQPDNNPPYWNTNNNFINPNKNNPVTNPEPNQAHPQTEPDPDWLLGASTEPDLNFPNIISNNPADPIKVIFNSGSNIIKSKDFIFHQAMVGREIQIINQQNLIPENTIIIGTGNLVISQTAALSSPVNISGEYNIKILISESDLIDGIILNSTQKFPPVNYFLSNLFTKILSGPKFIGSGGDQSQNNFIPANINLENITRKYPGQLFKIKIKPRSILVTSSNLLYMVLSDNRQIIKNIGVQSLVINGEYDRLTTPRNLKYFANNLGINNPASGLSRIPLAKTVVFAWASHDISGSNQLFMRILERFIRYPDFGNIYAGNLQNFIYPYY